MHTLSDGALYGYEIMKIIQRVIPEVYDGSIYAVLRRLHAAGYTQIFWQESTGGPPRKYYQLTDMGRKRLLETRDNWRSLQLAVQKLGMA